MHKEPINLLKLNVIVADGVCLSLHTQYCNGGDLADYLQGKHLFHQNKVANVTVDIMIMCACSGVSYQHVCS